MALKGIPISRKEDIVIQELNDEVLIYDLAINKAYCLNPTSTMIYHLCDGNHSISNISSKLSKQLKSTVSQDLIWLAIDQLKQNNLLENKSEVETKFDGLSRREVIRKVGFASMIALPMISSLVAPTAAMAQSGAAAPVGCTSGGVAGGSGLNGACFCAAGTPNSTACGTGDGSLGAPSTFCKAGCTCTTLATQSPTSSCATGGACRGTCG